MKTRFFHALLLLAAAAAIHAADPRATPPADWIERLPTQVGAKIDEKSIDLTLRVNPAAPAEPNGDSTDFVFATITDALHAALPHLEAGRATRIQLAPAYYRESVGKVNFRGKARDTLLVIEGDSPATTVWTGADLWPASDWESLGDGVYAHDWPHRFKPYTSPWGAKDYLGHRHEMVFIDGSPLRQQLLERYSHEFKGGDVQATISGGKRRSVYTFEGLQTPDHLEVGAFGVIEREDSGELAGKIYIRPIDEAAFLRHGAEVTTRRQLADFSPKNNLVLRNLTLTKTANGIPPGGVQGPLAFEPGGVYENILIENCRFLWNNADGLRPSRRSSHWTLRDSVFNYNGYNGIGGDLDHALLENNTTNFNNWRGHQGGVNSWFVAGVKLHDSEYNLIRNHEAIGNLAPGFWYDIHCGYVYMEDLTSALNTVNLFWELSWGPFHAKRALLAMPHGRGRAFNASIVTNYTLEDSILYADTDKPEAREEQGYTPVFRDQFYLRSDTHAIRDGHPVAGDVRLLDSVVFGGPSQKDLLKFNTPAGREGLYQNFNYKGINNIFWAPDPTNEPFSVMNASWATRSDDFEAWAKKYETDSTWADPQFVDPAAGDFRLKPDSPFADRIGELPARRIDPATLRAAQDFFQWARFDADFEILD